MPVLTDAERAQVGTIYKQDSPFAARKIGAALVAKNAATHIETRMMDKTGCWRPLVYCWRGGQRSGSFATILGQIGWQVEVLEGGYRSYRRQVVTALYEQQLPFQLLRLDGLTGTGKTAVLGELGTRGRQVLDLEGLAGHRGSVLGATRDKQPAQKGFESALSGKMFAFDRSLPVLVEAESARIGDIRLPPALWTAMCAAPKLVFEAPPEARAGFLAARYADLYAEPDRLLAQLELLRPLVGSDVLARWQIRTAEKEWQTLALDLIQTHYDPAYLRARRKDHAPEVKRLAVQDLSQEGISDLADQVERYLDTH